MICSLFLQMLHCYATGHDYRAGTIIVASFIAMPKAKIFVPRIRGTKIVARLHAQGKGRNQHRHEY